jgi:hypothetical protein
MNFSKRYEVITDCYEHTINFFKVLAGVTLLSIFWIGVRMVIQ